MQRSNCCGAEIYVTSNRKFDTFNTRCSRCEKPCESTKVPDKTVSIDSDQLLTYIELNTTKMIRKTVEALIADRERLAMIDGMTKAKSRVLRSTEIPANAKDPTRDAIVILGEQIAERIDRDITDLQLQTSKEDDD